MTEDEERSNSAKTSGTKAGAAKRARVAIRVHPTTRTQVSYWAGKAGISDNEYMAEAVEEKIRRENMDYDLPTLEQKRLAELVDRVLSLEKVLANLERVTTSGFSSLIGLARGGSYLNDEETGELDERGGDGA